MFPQSIYCLLFSEGDPREDRKGMEAPCSFPILCSTHHFYLTSLELYSFIKKKTGDLVKISFSEFGEPLEQINQT